MILFEMLMGRVPFIHAHPLKVFEMHLRAATPDLRALIPGMPPELAEVVRRCLEKNVNARFGDADALLSALDALHEAGLRAAGDTSHPVPRTQRGGVRLDLESRRRGSRHSARNLIGFDGTRVRGVRLPGRPAGFDGAGIHAGASLCGSGLGLLRGILLLLLCSKWNQRFGRDSGSRSLLRPHPYVTLA